MKVPSPVDELMWAVAESHDPETRAEFETRYPHYRPELARRISMVAGLKGEGRRLDRSRPLPEFRSVARKPPPPARWTVLAVGGLALAALGMASYAVTSAFSRPSPSPSRPLVVYEPKPVVIPEPKVIYVNPPPPPTSSVEAPEPMPVPAYLRPQNLKLAGAPLLSALKMIAAQGGLSLTVGPGMPNPDVKIDYRDRTTIEMLQDLGSIYAFTAFDQGKGSVLVIPAVDPDRDSGTRRTESTVNYVKPASPPPRSP